MNESPSANPLQTFAYEHVSSAAITDPQTSQDGSCVPVNIAASTVEPSDERAAPPRLIVWLLIGYMWLYLHRPFEIWTILATFRLERIYMLLTVVYWIAFVPKTFISNRLNWYHAGFVLVILASWLTSPYPEVGQRTVEDYLKCVVFYGLLISSINDARELRLILLGLVAIMALLMVHSLYESTLGNFWYRQGIWRMKGVGVTFSDFNDFSGLLVIAVPFAWLIWAEYHKWWQRGGLLGYLGMSAYCIYLTASRMGACGFAFAAMSLGGLSKHRWKMLLAFSLILSIAFVSLPEGHRERYLSIVDSEAGTAEAQRSAGHLRYAGFKLGMEIFSEHPLLGVGPMASRTQNDLGSMPHNLYGQLLGELGFAGAVFFFLFAWTMLRSGLESHLALRCEGDPDRRLAYRTLVASGLACLLTLLMGWGFNFLFWHIWLWLSAFQVVALHVVRSTEPSPVA